MIHNRKTDLIGLPCEFASKFRFTNIQLTMKRISDQSHLILHYYLVIRYRLRASMHEVTSVNPALFLITPARFRIDSMCIGIFCREGKTNRG